MFWSFLTRISDAPTAAQLEAVVPVSSFEQQSRLESGDETGLTAYRDAAIAFLDGPGRLGVALTPQQWRVTLPEPVRELCIPFGPLLSVNAVKHDDDDVAFVLRHDTVKASGFFSVVEFTNGYADVPADLKMAIRQIAAHWFEHRESVVIGDVSEIPMSTKAILEAYRHGVVA